MPEDSFPEIPPGARFEELAGLSRRDLLKAMGAFGAVSASGAFGSWVAPRLPSGRSASSLVRTAAGTRAAGGDLGAVEHVVFLMMENRSYDHYFGAYPRGRGFDDHPKHSLGAFEQNYPAGRGLRPKRKLVPFHLTHSDGEDCTKDLTHDWGPMHECWNHGRMDRFVEVHTSSKYEGSRDGALTMGYYTRKELDFYWALADHFTLGDAYHASILGPTHPNRLMANSGTIDPAGTRGGPITDTSGASRLYWSCTWPTVQEVLEDAGVSWKVYTPSNDNVQGTPYAAVADYGTWSPSIYDPSRALLLTDHVLPYFKAFEDPNSSLHQKAFGPTFPLEFANDVSSGTLPSVSWIIPPLGFDEHPSAPPAQGMWVTQLVLDALTSNPDVWSKTVLFLMYDENDGWFDHVPPPTAPKGTPGEWLTAKTISSETLGIRGPMGLGVRVPLLVISPFARGGHIAKETFDHTSQLKFIAERFGVEVPNVSKWRRNAVGDLTSTLFRGRVQTSVPPLPQVPTPPANLSGTCSSADIEQGGADPQLKKHQRMPTQRGTTIAIPKPRRRHHHGANSDEPASIDIVPVDVANRGPRSSTRKADFNALLHESGDSGRPKTPTA